MHTILVSGVSGIIGYGILKSLRQSHPDARLVGTTVYERNAGRAFCDIFVKAPMTNHANYLPWLVDTFRRWDVSVAIPGIEADVFAWNENREAIEETGTRVLLNNSDLINLCADKWHFYQRLTEVGSFCAIPSSLAYDDRLGGFPLLAKPRRGSGSKGVTFLENRFAYDKHVATYANTMLYQPIIGTSSEEYTCSGFFDLAGRLCSFISMRRTLSSAGFTETAEVVDLQGAEETLIHLGQVFNPVGPTNFQFRLDKGRLKLLEINPRISSATSIRAAFGYNESAMGVELLLNGNAPDQPKVKSGYAVRYTEDAIFYDSSNI